MFESGEDGVGVGLGVGVGVGVGFALVTTTFNAVFATTLLPATRD